MKDSKSPAKSASSATVPAYQLRLYVAGQTSKSLAAFNNLKRICENHLAGQYRIELIDLLKTPQLAAGDQILAVPTLVRRLPEPIKKIIGDLSNEERVLVGLDVQPLTDGGENSAVSADDEPVHREEERHGDNGLRAGKAGGEIVRSCGGRGGGHRVVLVSVRCAAGN